MIDKIDHRLEKWITGIIDDPFQVSFEHPGKTGNTPTVSVYLYGLGDALPSTITRNTPSKATLSYLLTVQSDNPIDSHRTLAKLLFSAKETPEFEIKFTSLPAAYWQSFGIIPLPYFILCLPLVKTRDEKPIPIIKQLPDVDMRSIIHIEGIVIGPDKHPVRAAKITMEHTKTTAYTDNNGNFIIAVGSTNLNSFNCKINTKEQEYSISIPMQKTQNAPITIHLDTIEV